MRFGTLDTFAEFGDWGFRMGRPVANEAFLRALLTYGTYDAYHFYCPDMASRELFQKRIEVLVKSPELRRRIVLGTHVQVSSAMRDVAFDVFHLGDFTYFLPPLARLRNQVRPGAHFPITGITHSLDGTQMHTRFLQLTLAELKPYDGIVCTSRSAAEFVRRKFDEVSSLFKSELGVNLRCPATTKVIPLGVEDDLYREQDRQAARAFLNIPKDAVVALSVGRFSLRAKADWSPILELLARMKEAGELPRFMLILAGGAARDQEQLLQEIIQNRGLSDTVALCPNFQPEVKSTLYHAADFYVSLVDNYQETFGINVIEAMAAGLPVVASDFDGYRDAVIPDHNGFLVPTLSSADLPSVVADAHAILDPSMLRFCLSQMVAVDLEGLRASLLRLSRDMALRQSMGERSRALAERYRWPTIVREYETYWTELREATGRTRTDVPRDDVAGRTRTDVLRESEQTMANGGAALLAGHPTATYSHYVTSLLEPSDPVQITDVGRGLLEGRPGPIRYDDMIGLWSAEIEAAILGMLLAAPRRVEEVRSACRGNAQASPGDVDFHLLWLAKHGAIAISTRPRDRERGASLR